MPIGDFMRSSKEDLRPLGQMSKRGGGTRNNGFEPPRGGQQEGQRRKDTSHTPGDPVGVGGFKQMLLKSTKPQTQYFTLYLPE